tara:strand:+ start:94 stop:606 length:513 start_codon:yes stop_codon:yes gene_type:complete
MGLLFNLDTDTVKGSTKSLYCRISQITIQKDVNRVIISLSYYSNLEKTEPVDSISYEVIIYDEENPEGNELRLPSVLKLDLTQKVVIKEPIYNKELVKENVPYVSFDEEGEEITKYRELEIEKNIKVGEEERELHISALDAIQKDIFQFCYNKVKEELSSIFPNIEIKKE